MTHMRTFPHFCAVALTTTLWIGPALQAAAAPPNPFDDAVAAWHFKNLDDSAGPNSVLQSQGPVRVGQRCDGPAKAASLARGGDGSLADCAGGFLVAGQGAGGELNLTSAAVSLYARLRNPTGDWSSCGIVSKHGGGDRLTYNLYGNSGTLGFELGTERGTFRVDVPAQSIGATDWHDVVVRYDGKTLELFVDGVAVANRPASGKLRTGNTEPLVLAGYSVDGKPRGPFKGQLDTVALWKRALEDARVVALSGGKEEVERRREARRTARYAGLPKPVANYRKVVGSTDLETYSRAARAYRKWSIENDPYRPLYHFTGVESWINDPNGPIYHDGKYHLFYQFDPQVPDGRGGWRRSKRCWGHAVSDDLVHWQDWPVAVWPDSDHDRNGVYSGNTFVHEGRIHGLYTGNVGGHGETYGMLTWSEDGGLTFKKKMVMHNDQRPNKHSPVHWDAQVWKEGETWCQLIGGATEGRKQGAAWLWKSTDLLNWTLQRNIAPSLKHSRYWELPYLVPLDGRHVLMVGAGNPYWVGRYDPKTMEFSPETPRRDVDTGNYYSFNPHMVDDKGPSGAARRLMHGWATIGRPPAVAGVPYWESAHSIPRVISIKDNRLWQEPIPELQSLRRENKQIEKQTLVADKPAHLQSIRGDALEVVASFDRGSAKLCGLMVRADGEGNGTRVWADAGNRFGIEGRANTHFLDKGDPVQLRVFVDRGVLEVYCNGVAVTHKCFAPAGRVEVFAFSEGGEATLTSLQAWEMKPLWE